MRDRPFGKKKCERFFFLRSGDLRLFCKKSDFLTATKESIKK